MFKCDYMIRDLLLKMERHLIMFIPTLELTLDKVYREMHFSLSTSVHSVNTL